MSGFVLSNVARLYDGTSAEKSALHAGVDVHVEAGKIISVAPHDAGREGPPRIDASDWTVTPGLVDCHGHITIVGLSPEDIKRSKSVERMVWFEKILHTTLVDGGVTTLRDVGGATHYMKRIVDEGTVIGPRMKIAICMLSTTGGHADFLGPDRCNAAVQEFWGPEEGRPPMIVDGPWECRKRVREIAACGADLIKICASPGVASPGDKLEHQDFSAEEIEAICTEASARGLPVAAHAHSRNGIELAIRHGVRDIQHISFMDEPLAELAARHDCTVTPTSWVIQSLPAAPGLTDFVREKARTVSDVHAEGVRMARAANLRIIAGVDPVLPRMHGRNYMEMVALIKEGLTPLEAWHGMTGLAAREVGQPDTGTLTPGQRADLLICTEDVLDAPEKMDEGALLEVIKDGTAYRGGVPELPQRTYRDTTGEIWS